MIETPDPLSLTSKDAFANKTVIVTGGAGSIGRPLCIAFARAGANVVVNDFGSDANGVGSSTGPAGEVAEEIREMGYVAVADTHSVTEPEEIVKTAISFFGSIHVVINNAGIIHYAPFEKQSPDIIRKIFEVNALGAVSILHYAWPYFQAQKYGRVINFISDSIFGMPASTAYVLSRGAILGINRTLALEGKPYNITVNAVGPTSLSRMVVDLIHDIPPQMQEAMKNTYTGESNVPPILSLAHESNTVTGEFFNTGGYTVGRFVLGSVRPKQGCTTMIEAQKVIPQLFSSSCDVKEPLSIQDYLAFRASAG
ncbi:uncharacterized protein PAC_03427 [Phialocephala subalpina]|uniref:Uncharacterized protein n=1 Tax=Phialocephala subalpina TaxID=576137 RepID=A0A1L7WLA0_9HELO|nr:uncharacterized protein PAC_03427 [Phialocephala subalpina]